MDILSLLFKSIISYSVFLSSKKIVKTATNIGSNFKRSLQLHRCPNCWRLYSGELKTCTFCGSNIEPLFSDEEEYLYDYDDYDRRMGFDRYVYNGLVNNKNRGRYDTTRRTTDRKSSFNN